MTDTATTQKPRKRGRPKGSTNKGVRRGRPAGTKPLLLTLAKIIDAKGTPHEKEQATQALLRILS